VRIALASESGGLEHRPTTSRKYDLGRGGHAASGRPASATRALKSPANSRIHDLTESTTCFLARPTAMFFSQDPSHPFPSRQRSFRDRSPSSDGKCDPPSPPLPSPPGGTLSCVLKSVYRCSPRAFFVCGFFPPVEQRESYLVGRSSDPTVVALWCGRSKDMTRKRRHGTVETKRRRNPTQVPME
jgi:hypothetical protein